MYEQVRTTKLPNHRRVDLGIYVNPDDIGKVLREKGKLYLRRFRVVADAASFRAFAMSSGLIEGKGKKQWFDDGHEVKRNVFHLRHAKDADGYAQILAQFLVGELIASRKKCSFETVFSHPSKLDIMRRAREAGYKVYLYFIATNSPEINKDRVRTRVKLGGHDVPPDRIENRYYRSLEQLPAALELCYHAFMFDNSPVGNKGVMFGEMKINDNGRSWLWDERSIPDWFIRHYLLLTKNPLYEDVARRAMAERGH